MVGDFTVDRSKGSEAEIMNETARYALIILFASAVGLVAVLANRLTERVKVPVALLVLVGAAVAVHAVPVVRPPSERTVEHVITIALVLVLFDGGDAHRARRDSVPRRFPSCRSVWWAPSSPPPARRLMLHYACGDHLVRGGAGSHRGGAPDPAVVFSVLGRREIAGRGSTILEGESGANDPVGIA